MRRLNLVLLTDRRTVPVLLAAGIVGAPACGQGTTPDGPAITAASGGAAGTVGAGAARGGSGGTTLIPPMAGTGGAAVGCTYFIDLPPEGVPAEPGQICSSMPPPVESNGSARVTLTAEADLASAQGSVQVAEAVRGSVDGVSLIEVIDASEPWMLGMQSSNVRESPAGYDFDASFPDFPGVAYDLAGVAPVRMTLRVTLNLACDGQTTPVHAATDVHLCVDDDRYYWASSGDRCSVCRVIAEMAPSPIVPDQRDDDLPLAQALRLRLVELARVGGSVLLLAENDAGAGADYEWHANAGSIERLAPDVVVWRLEQGLDSPLIQVAVWNASAAAAASFTFNKEAA